ncbi:endopeptidase La [Candidatus Caldatribacterium saccharofermentans]|uniref:endopeptidase La n=1 Tax=Candidatus Caldatribacterium saccharofermentans TaxID=1454753 RepID=UPI003D08D70B
MWSEEWPALFEEEKPVELLERMLPSSEKRDWEFPEEIPVLPLEDNVLFPEIAFPWVVQGETWVRLVHEAVLKDKIIGVIALREKPGDRPLEPQDLYKVGVVGRISRMLRLPEEAVQILVFGLATFVVKEWVRWEPYPVARIEIVRTEEIRTDEVEALKRNILSLFQKVVELAPYLPKEAFVAAMNIKEPARLAHFVAFNLNLDVAGKQDVLASFDLVEKLKKVTYYLTRELEILQIGSKIQAQIQKEMAKTQREYFLREQLKAIQRELGELDERGSEITRLREKIKALGLAPEVEEEVEKELDRLSHIPTTSPEYPVIRNYIDWILELPWNKSTEDTLDVELARKILDEDHHDLEKVKERILEYLAVCQLKKDLKGPILCFVGPPGVGKTSLGKSIARSLGRRFVRISLGGVRDEAEIRGHRRTYVGAMPGRIIQGLRRAGTNNPVFMLDEIDKIGVDFRGDPAAALLEVLDPEQNEAFVDHYLGVPFNLSRVLFIATANVVDTIPPALLDRMELIFLSGYTDQDKLVIAKRYLVPKQCRENGIPEDLLHIPDETILTIVREYTREAGVRQLERNIASVCRKVAKRIASGEQGPFVVDIPLLREFLGPRRYSRDMFSPQGRVGVAVGLAWTEVGGEVLFVETVALPGKGNLILTGNMGKIMQESARIVLSCVRERSREWHIPEDFYEKKDIHIHVPAGAIPKDGPSAGVTMAVSLVSALTKTPPCQGLAMTGEVTLTGRVLPVGGIKEKVLAAYRAGIGTVILPKENEKDLEEVPEEVRRELQFHFVETLDEALALAFGRSLEEISLERRNTNGLG